MSGTVPTPFPIHDNDDTITVDDGGLSLTVDGTVGISNFPAVQPINDNGGSVTVDGSVSVSNLPTTQLVKPATPASADILAGAATVTNSVTETTLITIPAGRTWYGFVTVSTVWTGAASTAMKFAHIRTLGTGATPATTTVLARVNTTVYDQMVSGLLYVTAPVGNAVTVTLTAGGATTQVASGSAAGILL